MKSEIFLNVRCHSIFADLMSHLSRGLLEYNRQPMVDLKPAEAAFAQACIDKDVTLMFKGAVPGTPPAAEQSVIRQYLRRVRDAQLSAKAQGRVQPQVMGLNHDEFTTQHGEVFGEGYVIEAMPGHIGGVPVRFAMDRALWLFQRTISLVLVAEFLQEVAGKFHITSALAALGEARLELHRRVSRYLRDYASFALILNDPEHSAVARRNLYLEAFAPGYSVAAYLQGADRYDVPRRQNEQDCAGEQEFRAELLQMCPPVAGAK